MKISVIIPAYNSEKWIRRALDSVLGQSRRADEIVVVDDGSTDGTAEVVRSFGQNVILLQQENAGVSAARNAGIASATGDWIAFLDSDDEWLESYLETQDNVLSSHPDLVWSAANFLMSDSDEESTREKLSHEQGKMLLKGKDYLDEYFESFCQGATGWTGTIVIKKEIIEEAGYFVVDQAMGEDLDLWWRIAHRYPKIGYIAEPMAIYHAEVPGSASKSHRTPSVVGDLISRHLELAARHNSLERFIPCARHMLRFYLNKYLHDERIAAVPKMIDQFGNLLPRKYIAYLKILTACPRITLFCLPILKNVNKILRIKV